MSISSNRRQFLDHRRLGHRLRRACRSSGSLSKLPRVSAEEAKPDPKVVKLSDDIEPLVRLIEETPREKLLEEIAGRIRKGTTLSRSRRGAAPGRRAKRAAAAERGLQVPRGAGRELGPPGEHLVARRASLAADLLGARLFQVVAGRGRARRQLDDGAGR